MGVFTETHSGISEGLTEQGTAGMFFLYASVSLYKNLPCNTNEEARDCLREGMSMTAWSGVSSIGVEG